MDLALPNQPSVPLAAAEHFLTRIEGLIDWSRFEQPGTEGVAALAGDVPMFAIRIALLKQWYGLSDQEAPFQVLDRLSFRTFVSFFGDSGASDVRIFNELNDCAWARHPALIDAIEAVEEQLRDLGYAVRCGQVSEPSLTPCTESGGDLGSMGATSLFRPGELGRMVEAVTEKAHADGIVHPAQTAANVSGTTLDGPPESFSAPVPSGVSDGVRAILEWPWGQRTRLTEHLNIGRDYQFSPLAQDLTPYTHVSRKHAELLVYGEGVWVRDLGSRNGTYVNDEEVPKGQAYLIDSDSIIRFGPLLAVSLKLGS